VAAPLNHGSAGRKKPYPPGAFRALHTMQSIVKKRCENPNANARPPAKNVIDALPPTHATEREERYHRGSRRRKCLQRQREFGPCSTDQIHKTEHKEKKGAVSSISKSTSSNTHHYPLAGCGVTSQPQPRSVIPGCCRLRGERSTTLGPVREVGGCRPEAFEGWCARRGFLRPARRAHVRSWRRRSDGRRARPFGGGRRPKRLYSGGVGSSSGERGGPRLRPSASPTATARIEGRTNGLFGEADEARSYHSPAPLSHPVGIFGCLRVGMGRAAIGGPCAWYSPRAGRRARRRLESTATSLGDPGSAPTACGPDRTAAHEGLTAGRRVPGVRLAWWEQRRGRGVPATFRARSDSRRAEFLPGPAGIASGPVDIRRCTSIEPPRYQHHEGRSAGLEDDPGRTSPHGAFGPLIRCAIVASGTRYAWRESDGW